MGISLTELLDRLSAEVPECKYTSVIDSSTGLALAVSYPTNPPLDSAGTDAFHSELYRLSAFALRGTELAGEPQEAVLNSVDGTFVSMAIADTGHLWLVVTGRARAVGFVQAMMRKNVDRVGEQLRRLI